MLTRDRLSLRDYKLWKERQVGTVLPRRVPANIIARWSSWVEAYRWDEMRVVGAWEYLHRYGRNIGWKKCTSLARMAESRRCVHLAQGFWLKAYELEMDNPVPPELTVTAPPPSQLATHLRESRHIPRTAFALMLQLDRAPTRRGAPVQQLAQRLPEVSASTAYVPQSPPPAAPASSTAALAGAAIVSMVPLDPVSQGLIHVTLSDGAVYRLLLAQIGRIGNDVEAIRREGTRVISDAPAADDLIMDETIRKVL